MIFIFFYFPKTWRWLLNRILCKCCLFWRFFGRDDDATENIDFSLADTSWSYAANQYYSVCTDERFYCFFPRVIRDHQTAKPTHAEYLFAEFDFFNRRLFWIKKKKKIDRLKNTGLFFRETLISTIQLALQYSNPLKSECSVSIGLVLFFF